MNKLGQLREKWEGDIPVVAEQMNEHKDQCLVALRVGDTYRCHRYFKIGFLENTSWEVSVDGDKCGAETVIRWFADPSPLTCQQGTR